MRKIDIEDIINRLTEIKQFADKNLDYNSSTFINQQLIKILPLLNEEYKRLDTGKIDIQCPVMEVLSSEQAEIEGLTVVAFMNNRMQELVANGFKIIDFGLYDKLEGSIGVKPVYYMYIKYTN